MIIVHHFYVEMETITWEICRNNVTFSILVNTHTEEYGNFHRYLARAHLVSLVQMTFKSNNLVRAAAIFLVMGKLWIKLFTKWILFHRGEDCKSKS